jgi:hypothetical protein
MRQMKGNAETATRFQNISAKGRGYVFRETLKSLLENLEAPFQLELLASLFAGLQ